MLKLFLSVTTLLIVLALQAQQPVLQWAKVFEEHNPWNYSTVNNGRSVDVDQQGNVYSVGLFSYTIDFDPNAGVYDLAGGSWSNHGIYISKLDKDGNFAWVRQIPTVVEFGDIEIQVDPAGNVYVASSFRQEADMDPGPGVLMMTTYGFKDAFVIKLDTDGNLVWVKRFGGPGDTGAECNMLELDKDNNVIVGGLFNNTIDFDPGPGTYNITSSVHQQAFIVKLNNNGDLIWAKQFGNGPIVYHNSNIVDIKCDANGDIFTMGRFGGTCDFDPGPGVFNLTSTSIMDGFISKLTPNGDFVWAKRIGNTGYQYNYHMYSRAIAFDNMGNVFTTGSFIGTFDFDPGPAVYNVNSEASYSCFILKLTPQGDFVWVKTIDGTDYDSGNDMVIGNDNNIYIVGEFSPVVDFDPGPGDSTVTTPHYGASALVKLTSDGNFICAAAFPSIQYGTSLFRRMEIDANLNIYVTGMFGGIIDFDPSPINSYPLSSGANQAPFVLKLGPCTLRTDSTLVVSACNSYILNNETFDSSGTYIRTIPNAAGCDSVITLQLTLNKKATRQSITICEGEFFFAGGANQRTTGTYIDTLQTVTGCDSVVTTQLTVNPRPLPNLGPDKSICTGNELAISPGSFDAYQWQDMSTADSFTIAAPGIYWVKVTNAFQCTTTDSLVVPALLPTPSNFLKEKDSLCSYASLDISSSRSYSQYEWSTGGAQRQVTLKQPGTYWLTVTDANGCSGSDTIIILPKQCMAGFFCPSAFTPNGDRNNDIFKPLLHGNVKQYRLIVYNRWGAVVFQSTEPQKGWDGTISGKPQSTETFVWICTYQFEGEEPKTEKGVITLIR